MAVSLQKFMRKSIYDLSSHFYHGFIYYYLYGTTFAPRALAEKGPASILVTTNLVLKLSELVGVFRYSGIHMTLQYIP